MSSRPALLVLAALALAVAVGGVTSACGTDPVGVDACRRIEGARCENAASCGIDLSQPAHRGDSANLDVGACKRFYDDQCLHGLVVTEDPGNLKVQACVDTLNDPATSCDVIVNPEHAPACSFLSPTADAAVE